MKIGVVTLRKNSNLPYGVVVEVTSHQTWYLAKPERQEKHMS